MSDFNYENNQYLKRLNDLGEKYYLGYVSCIKKYIKNENSKFLDVGCGNGVVLGLLEKKGFNNGFGVDISKLFIKDAKKRGIKNALYYNGTKLPFENKYFDLVGSFNVLEHTKNPQDFIKNQIDILKPKGIIIIMCPNFLSSILFNNWHPRLKGGKRKIKNLLIVIKKILGMGKLFESIPPIKTKVFKYDSDAIAVTNLMDIKKVLNKLNCEVIFESGFINYDNLITKVINTIPLTRYVSPSCFIVARKNK